MSTKNVIWIISLKWNWTIVLPLLPLWISFLFMLPKRIPKNKLVYIHNIWSMKVLCVVTIIVTPRPLQAAHFVTVSLTSPKRYIRRRRRNRCTKWGSFTLCTERASWTSCNLFSFRSPISRNSAFIPMWRDRLIIIVRRARLLSDCYCIVSEDVIITKQFNRLTLSLIHSRYPKSPRGT